MLFALGALIVGGQQFCDLMAYANAKIALVASLMETSIVFNIPAILLFPKLEQYLTRRLKLESEPAPGERLTKTNWAVAIVVTAGAILIGG
ncbi:MAG TPA: hypothetical protein VLG92_03590 [Candidatus Saccharimonadia bacterium]|nr:hypothetical protein [Candidatus Saccharimonadia bacterium]